MGTDKVFVMGIDGATMDIMMPMIERGELPTFAKIINNGGYGRLKSTVPPLSPPAWVSFATGKNPGKNGIIGFTKMIPNSYRLKLMSGLDNRSKTIWELLSLAGKKVIVLNVPMTYPPKSVNGLLISGLDTPDVNSSFTYPDQLKKEILSRFPDYKINLHLGGYLQTDKRRKKALRMIFDSIVSRYRVAEYLMDNYSWDFFTVKFNNPDIVQHHFWKYINQTDPDYDPDYSDDFKEAIFSVYKKLDKIALSFIEKLDKDTTFIVVSDHGAGPRINKTVYINEWLKANDYLHVIKDTKHMAKRYSVIGDIKTYLNESVSFLFKHTSPQIRIFLKNLMPDIFSRLSLSFKFSGGLSGIDWSKTNAFLAEEESIRINLKGLYPQGIVDDKDYINLRNEIIQKLKRLKDLETGETIFQNILTREDAFCGLEDFDLPDIQMIPMEAKYDITGKWFNKGDIKENTFVRHEKHSRGANGMHRPEGIFFIQGPQCKPSQELENINLIDVCPTILHQMGVPVLRDMDGRVIEEIFCEDFLNARPIEYEECEERVESDTESNSVYSVDEESKIMDNLKSLGYIE